MSENVPSYFVNICMQNSLKVIIWPLKNIPKNFITQNFMMIQNFKKCRILWWFQICSHGFKIWPKKVTSTCKNIANSIESGKAQNLYNLILEHFFGISRKSAFLKSRTILWRKIFWGHTWTSGKLWVHTWHCQTFCKKLKLIVLPIAIMLHLNPIEMPKTPLAYLHYKNYFFLLRLITRT